MMVMMEMMMMVMEMMAAEKHWTRHYCKDFTWINCFQSRIEANGIVIMPILQVG